MKRNNLLPYFLIILFLATRFFIWYFKPTAFTEIIYNYMPDAHLWASGVQPYLEQWYEYPPATIPLFYIPHLIDQGTMAGPIHIDYAEAYRGILLLIDTGIFSLIWLTLRHFKVKSSVFVGALIYYMAATSKAHHFMYDTIDLVFAGAMVLGVTSSILWKNNKGIFMTWFGYFLGIGIKYINGPLGLPYALMERKKWKKNLGLGLIAFLLVWGLPLILYRSSLSVSLVYHQIRGLQIDSAGAVITRAIDSFTHSETIVEIYSNYDITGPISTQVKHIVDIIFPISLILVLGYYSWLILKTKEQNYDRLKIHLTFSYILVFMLAGKVASTPFLLWHIPFLALFPFSNLKEQLWFTIPSLIIIVLSMSPIPQFPIGPFNSHIWIGLIRVTLFSAMLWRWMNLRNRLIEKKSITAN